MNDKDQFLINARNTTYIFDHGAQTPIGSPAAFPITLGVEMNNSSQVVGTMRKGRRQHAFVFTDGETYDLNDLFPATFGWGLQHSWVFTHATRMNEKGEILGNGYLDGLPRSFLLTPGQTSITPVPTDDPIRPRAIGSIYIDSSPISQWRQDYDQYFPDSREIKPRAYAKPGADLSDRDLTKAYLINAELAGASFTGSDLTSARLDQATLRDCDFTDAIIRDAGFELTTARGFTANQL